MSFTDSLQRFDRGVDVFSGMGRVENEADSPLVHFDGGKTDGRRIDPLLVKIPSNHLQLSMIFNKDWDNGTLAFPEIETLFE